MQKFLLTMTMTLTMALSLCAQNMNWAGTYVTYDKLMGVYNVLTLKKSGNGYKGTMYYEEYRIGDYTLTLTGKVSQGSLRLTLNDAEGACAEELAGYGSVIVSFKHLNGNTYVSRDNGKFRAEWRNCKWAKGVNKSDAIAKYKKMRK